MLQQITDAVVSLAASPWSLAVLFGIIVIDGVIPPIPSETSVLALASLTRQPGTVPLWSLLIVAAAGAFVGDLVAFTLGRLVPVRRLPLLRSGRGAATVSWAEAALARRGAAFLLAARYIPIARVVANLSAGALGFPRRRFVAIAAIGGIGWAVWICALGVGAGHLLAEQPLLGAAVGAVAGAIIGAVLDKVLSRRFGRPRIE